MPDLVVADLSHYNTVTDLAAAKAAGLVGVIHKATEGTSYTDPAFKERQAQAEDAGLAFASYHFLKHGDIASQIANYLDFAEPPHGGRVCIDYEDAALTLDDLHQAVDAILALDASLQIAIYGGSLLKGQLGMTHDAKLAAYALWLAQYTTGTPSWPSQTWPLWTLWQFTDKATVAGISGAVDGNRFNGSPENCLKWLSPAVPAPGPAPEPEPDQPVVAVALTVPDGVELSISVNGQQLNW